VKFRIEQVLKRPNELRRSAEIITKLYPRVEAPQPIDLEMALLANQMLGRFDQAKGILDQWRQMYPEDRNRTQFEQMYGIDQLVRMVDSSRDFSAEEILAEIAKLGAITDPGVAQLYSRLVTYMAAKAADKPVYTEVIQSMVESPDADGVVLTVAGTDAMTNQNYGRGRQLLQRATEKAPDRFEGWNNLAVLIHQAFPEDIDAALRAANKAYELAPRNDNVLETRGMILLDLQRWQEAVDDLELALNSRQGDKKIHKALSTAYRNLGREQLAKIHESKSK
jgi:tetratricopeptide (TPR) repeat protein